MPAVRLSDSNGVEGRSLLITVKIKRYCRHHLGFLRSSHMVGASGEHLGILEGTSSLLTELQICISSASSDF